MKIMYSLLFLSIAFVSQCMYDVQHRQNLGSPAFGKGVFFSEEEYQRHHEMRKTISPQQPKTLPKPCQEFNLEAFLEDPSITISGKKYPVCMDSTLRDLLSAKKPGLEKKLENAISDIELCGVSQNVSHINLLLINEEISIQPARKRW